MSNRVEFREERCKGCLLCTAVCPTGIIRQSERFNQKGYKVAEIALEERTQCKGCGFCALICPDYVINVYRPARTSGGKK